MRLELIHPMIVHFPIVFVMSLLAFDAFAMFRGWRLIGRGPVGTASFSLALAAAAFALLAYGFGDKAFDIAKSTATVPVGLMERHATFGAATTTLVLLWAVVRLAIWWRDLNVGRRGNYLVLALETVLVALILMTALYGGELVYEHGVAVASAV